MDTMLLDDFAAPPPPKGQDRKGRQEHHHASVFWGQFKYLVVVVLSTLGMLSEMHQGLERYGGGALDRVSTPTFQTL